MIDAELGRPQDGQPPIPEQEPQKELSLQEALRIQSSGAVDRRENSEKTKAADKNRQEMIISFIRIMGVATAVLAAIMGLVQSSYGGYFSFYPMLLWCFLGAVGMLGFYATAEIVQLLKTIAENTQPKS